MQSSSVGEQQDAASTSKLDVSPRSNRIVVLSLQGLANESLTQLVHSITDDETSNDDVQDDTIPWQIDNNYYTANVHFKTVEVEMNSLEQLKSELNDVQAVVVVVQNTSKIALKDHQGFLDLLDRSIGSQEEEDAMPAAFGLAVSVVVALPSSLSLRDQRDDDEGEKCSAEQVAELYGDHGWEYIDLGKDLLSSLINDEDDDDGQTDEGEEDTNESQGLARVKEALEANLWPNHSRKEINGNTRRKPDTASSLSKGLTPEDDLLTGNAAGKSQLEDDLDDDDDNFDAMFRQLNLNIPSGGSVTDPENPFLPPVEHIEPTSADEDLARKFLSSIAEFESQQQQQSSSQSEFDLDSLLHTRPETDSERKVNQENALKKLEEFLQSEDSTWPASELHKKESGNGLAFEDDFDEFVKAPVAQSVQRDQEDNGKEWIDNKSKDSE
ncbi:unnamed protein product [Sympodiomycopsis kandeliae]